MALLKMAALALVTFASGLGVLKVSILYESYFLLLWGVGLSLAGFLMVFRPMRRHREHLSPAE